MVKLAIIRVRGPVNTSQQVKDTMTMLGLELKQSCVVLEVNPSIKGMIAKVKDYVTYGEVSEETIKALDEKRGKKAIRNDFKTVYFLAPPKGGFDKKGIKRSFVVGGALGYRGKAINDMIKKMY